MTLHISSSLYTRLIKKFVFYLLKVMRHTNPSAIPKKPKSLKEVTAPTTSKDDKSDEVCLNVGFRAFCVSFLPFFASVV